MRRMKSSPIFLLMPSREREMDPVVARRAGSGVVAVMVVESKSSKRDVWRRWLAGHGDRIQAFSVTMENGKAANSWTYLHRLS